MQDYIKSIRLLLTKCQVTAFAALLVLGSCKSVPADKATQSQPALSGQDLFGYYGCKTCHSLSGETTLYGPPLNDVINKEIEVLRTGMPVKIKVDRDYLLRSVKEPGYEKVRNYENRIMPVPNLTQDQINQIVDYLVSVNTINKKN